ncbi:hypothetical protein CRUP_035555, partial [Coryphaenoides rupestris]
MNHLNLLLWTAVCGSLTGTSSQVTVTQTPVVSVTPGSTATVTLGVVQPTLSLLSPSRVQLEQGSATLLCVATGGFPSDWQASGWT